MKFILIGMPGCGKTALGRNAARKLQCHFCDLDSEIEKNEGRTIGEIFKKDGEEYFRKAETAALGKAVSMPKCGNAEIISSGGGIVVKPENIEMMSNAFVIFIDRPLECIKSDIDTSERPLLTEDKDRLNRLYDERIALYTGACDAHILNNESFSAALNKLIGIIKKESSKESNNNGGREK